MDANVTIVCPEDILILECTIIVNGSVGDSTIIWKGTVFRECNDGVVLPHTRFSGENYSIQCNKGDINITAWSTKDSNSFSYSNRSLLRSQLVALVQHDMIDNDNSIECIHEVNGSDSIIGKIHLTSDSAVCNDTSTAAPEKTLLVNQSKGIKIIISSSIVLPLILLLSTIILFLLYGFRKKIALSNWPFPV